MFLGFFWFCLPKSWNLRTGKHTQYLRQESYSENQRARSYINQLSTLGALCSKLNDDLMCRAAALNLNAKQCQLYMQEGRRKVEATSFTHYHETLSNKMLIQWRTHVLGPCRKPNFISIQWVEHPKPYPVLIHWWVLYAILFFAGVQPAFLHVQLYSTFLHCGGIP